MHNRSINQLFLGKLTRKLRYKKKHEQKNSIYNRTGKPKAFGSFSQSTQTRKKRWKIQEFLHAFIRTPTPLNLFLSVGLLLCSSHTLISIMLLLFLLTLFFFCLFGFLEKKRWEKIRFVCLICSEKCWQCCQKES